MRVFFILLAYALSGCGENSGGGGGAQNPHGENRTNQESECSDLSCMPENFVPSQRKKGSFVQGCDWKRGEVLVDDVCGKPLVRIDNEGFVSFGREGASQYLFRGHPDKDTAILSDETFGIVNPPNEFGYRFAEYPQLSETVKIPFYVMRIEMEASPVSEVFIGRKISDEKLPVALDIFGLKQSSGSHKALEISQFCEEIIAKFQSIAGRNYDLDRSVNEGTERTKYCTAKIREVHPGNSLRNLWTIHATWKCVSSDECYFSTLSYG